MQHQHYAQAHLSRPASLILASLAHGPRRVIALQEAIEQVEGFSIEPGTLYRVLAHLEHRGWIEGLHADGPLRRYRITALGMLVLESAEAGRQREQPQEGGRPALLRGVAMRGLPAERLACYNRHAGGSQGCNHTK